MDKKILVAVDYSPTDQATNEAYDLIAMTTHGHRFLKDLIYGSTITQVRHRAPVPVLLVNAAK